MDKTKFTNLIDKLAVYARQDNWIPKYDRKLDYFYWHKSPVGENINLIKVSHETSLYVDSNGRIKGLFVEYLKNNFIEHNPAFENVTDLFTKKISGSLYTIPKIDDKIKTNLSGLVESLRADIYRDACDNKIDRKVSVDDYFNNLISFASEN
jgi:hypothetical protein